MKKLILGIAFLTSLYSVASDDQCRQMGFHCYHQGQNLCIHHGQIRLQSQLGSDVEEKFIKEISTGEFNETIYPMLKTQFEKDSSDLGLEESILEKHKDILLVCN